MTIEVNYNPIRQQGNGVTTQFSYDFYALSDQYLVVYIEEDGVQTVTTDYTATVSETGGIVTFNVAPTENQYVVITRSTTISQEVPYTTSRGFDAKVVESSFDKDCAINQEQSDLLRRTPKIPSGYNIDVVLPLPETGKALVWKDNNGTLENSEHDMDSIAYSCESSAESASNSAIAAANSAEQARVYVENMVYGAYRYTFSQNEWQQAGDVYKITIPDVSMVLGVYKSGTYASLVSNIDISVYDSGVVLSTLSPFDGYCMIANSVNNQVVYTQTVASDTWVYYHGLGKYPQVTIIDDNGVVMVGTITYNNLNAITVTFTSEVTGKLILN